MRHTSKFITIFITFEFLKTTFGLALAAQFWFPQYTSRVCAFHLCFQHSWSGALTQQRTTTIDS